MNFSTLTSTWMKVKPAPPSWTSWECWDLTGGHKTSAWRPVVGPAIFLCDIHFVAYLMLCSSYFTMINVPVHWCGHSTVLCESMFTCLGVTSLAYSIQTDFLQVPTSIWKKKSGKMVSITVNCHVITPQCCVHPWLRYRKTLTCSSLMLHPIYFIS